MLSSKKDIETRWFTFWCTSFAPSQHLHLVGPVVGRWKGIRGLDRLHSISMFTQVEIQLEATLQSVEQTCCVALNSPSGQAMCVMEALGAVQRATLEHPLRPVYPWSLVAKHYSLADAKRHWDQNLDAKQREPNGPDG